MIKNMRELVDAYDRLYLMTDMNKFMEERGQATPKWVQDKIAGMKREIREFTHRTSDRRVIRDNWIDGYTLLIYCPDYVTTKEEAEDWFEAEERIEYIPRDWDCTGQAFTGWHHIGILGGKYVCWHDVRYDV